MYLPTDPNRPSLADRYEMFLDRKFQNWVVDALQRAYEETHNETIALIRQRIITHLNRADAQEQRWRDQEIVEGLKMLSKLPEVQRQYLTYYMEKDLE